MNDNELKAVAEKIWYKLNSLSANQMTKEEQLDFIKGVVIDVESEAKKVGSNSVLNYLSQEIDQLRPK